MFHIRILGMSFSLIRISYFIGFYILFFFSLSLFIISLIVVLVVVVVVVVVVVSASAGCLLGPWVDRSTVCRPYVY